MKRVSEKVKKNKEKIIEAAVISTCLVAAGIVIYKKGYNKCDNDMCKFIIDRVEEGEHLFLTDNTTYRIYEITGECIGD